MRADEESSFEDHIAPRCPYVNLLGDRFPLSDGILPTVLFSCFRIRRLASDPEDFWRFGLFHFIGVLPRFSIHLAPQRFMADPPLTSSRCPHYGAAGSLSQDIIALIPLSQFLVTQKSGGLMARKVPRSSGLRYVRAGQFLSVRSRPTSSDSRVLPNC